MVTRAGVCDKPGFRFFLSNMKCFGNVTHTSCTSLVDSFLLYFCQRGLTNVPSEGTFECTCRSLYMTPDSMPCGCYLGHTPGRGPCRWERAFNILSHLVLPGWGAGQGSVPVILTITCSGSATASLLTIRRCRPRRCRILVQGHWERIAWEITTSSVWLQRLFLSIILCWPLGY